MLFLVYGVIFASWLVYFLVLKSYSLNRLVFHTLMTLAILVAIIYSLGEYYIWQSTTGYVSNSVSRISLGFKNPLLAAYFLGMLWMYSTSRTLTLFATVKEKTSLLIKEFIHLVLYAGITLALLLTFTRSAWIAAAIALGIWLALQIAHVYRHGEKQKIARFLVGASVLLVVTLMVGYAFKKEINLRNTDFTSESENTLAAISLSIGKANDPTSAMTFYQNVASYSSAQIRLLEWKWGIRTWTGSVKNFIFGVGPDAGFFEMPKYRDAIFNNFPTDSATKPFYVRSIYINTAMQLGLLGIVFLVGSTYLFISWLLKNANLDFTALAVVVGFLSQGIFYFSTQLTVVLLIFVIAYLVSAAGKYTDETLRTPNMAEKVLFILLAAGLLIWVLPIARAEMVTTSYIQAALPAPVDEMVANAKLPIDNNVLVRYLVYHYSNDSRAKAYLPSLALSNDVDDLRIASDAYYMLARSDNSIEYTQKAIDTSLALLKIDNTLPATWDGLGLRYLFLGDFIKASDSFKKAIELKEDYWYAYMHMGEISRQQCNPKEAIEWYIKAEKYIPTAENEITEAGKELVTPRPECK